MSREAREHETIGDAVAIILAARGKVVGRCDAAHKMLCHATEILRKQQNDLLRDIRYA